MDQELFMMGNPIMYFHFTLGMDNIWFLSWTLAPPSLRERSMAAIGDCHWARERRPTKLAIYVELRTGGRGFVAGGASFYHCLWCAQS
jgi:hypothetical protein